MSANKQWRMRMLVLVSLIGGVLPLVSATPVLAATRQVATSGADVGTCLLVPCHTIGYAVGQATDGDTITVAAGTYTEHDIIVAKSLTISGAGANTTTLNICCVGVVAGRGFEINAGQTVTISGLTMQGGYPGRGQSGGAIYNAGTLTLTNDVITGNSASTNVTFNPVQYTHAYGGGIYNATNATLTLNGTTVSNNLAGTPPTDGPDQLGGEGRGIATDGTLIVQGNSTISDNHAIDDGGGILIMGNAPKMTIANTTISGNVVPIDGAAIYLVRAPNYTTFLPVMLDHVTVSGNNPGSQHGSNAVSVRGLVNLTMKATAITNNTGGGIDWNGTFLDVSDSVISDNTTNGGAQAAGGSFEGSQCGQCTITRTTVSNNEDTTNNRPGGLNVYGVVITNSTITGNKGRWGGIGQATGSAPISLINSVVSSNAAGGPNVRVGGIDANINTIVNSTISNNTSTGDTGGIRLPDHATVTGSTISGNSGPTAGGMRVIGGNTTITNTTVSDNTGAGIYYGSRGLNNKIVNTTVAGNTTGITNPGTGSQSDPVTVSNSILTNTGPNCGVDPINSGGYNIVTDVSCGWASGGTDQIGVDPKIAPLANNGGPTQTHALMVGSPAIDRIPASGANCPATDQRGVARPSGAGCDVGRSSSR